MPNLLDAEFKFYCDNQMELAKQYEGKVLIIKDQKVIGSYDTKREAYERAVEEHELGTFLMQECSSDPESTIVRVHSRVIAGN